MAFILIIFAAIKVLLQQVRVYLELSPVAN